MNKKYIVTLTADERASLHQMISVGKAAARKLLHARISLKADASQEGPGWTDEHISESLEVSTTTIGRVRQQFVEHNLIVALERRSPCGHRVLRLDGEAEAHLVALACSPAPTGHTHWTIRLLADKLVELGYVERVGRETVRQTLKKTNSSRGAKSSTVFLPRPMPLLSVSGMGMSSAFHSPGSSGKRHGMVRGGVTGFHRVANLYHLNRQRPMREDLDARRIGNFGAGGCRMGC